MYHFAITKDKLAETYKDEKSSVGIFGPRGSKLGFDEITKHPKGEKFRLKDGDGMVYYHGVFVNEDETASGFEPLDDFGTPMSGCAYIEYFVNRKWQPL